MKRLRRAVVGLLVPLLLPSLLLGPVFAEDPIGSGEVRLVPAQGGRVVFGSGSYSGELSLVASAAGLGLVERQTVDGYLAGIREVPFSWPAEALQAQAIAARTYLAWTLRRGRSEAGMTYGFDICASTRCQVYRGAGVVDGPAGSRWLAALDATSDQILIFDDAPAQALYSASHGSSSRGVEEIWGGGGLPYLVRVDSPERGVSPFDSWTVEMPAEVFAQVLRANGVSVGFDIQDVFVSAVPGSRSTMRIVSSAGNTTLPLTTVRAAFNIHGPALYPGLFPGDRNDGRRLPQSVPSYSFSTRFTPEPEPVGSRELLPPGDLPEHGIVEFAGQGWGHGVGMSQWGAFAMAETGAGAGDILAHYYRGLEPQESRDLLPPEVFVGLAWDERVIEFAVVGEVAMVTAGGPPVSLAEGRWIALQRDGAVVIFAVPLLTSARVTPR